MENLDASTPPSREVRWADGLAEGQLEQIAFQLHSTDTSGLVKSLVSLELVVELKRAQAVQELVVLLKQKLALDGYMVVSSIDETAEQWYEREATET